ncbi:MAG: hypothetical protein MJK14_14815 [Rivularia sp. ALOHA_DT_140]|nr:hypothetical protein [Rivularia sp. ALOHA_DT_140]
MIQIQETHSTAMDLAEAAFTAKLQGNLEQASQLIREAFENEQAAAELIAHQLDAEPSRSILHRSAATRFGRLWRIQSSRTLDSKSFIGKSS